MKPIEIVERLEEIADALRLKSFHGSYMDDLTDLAEELQRIIEELAKDL